MRTWDDEYWLEPSDQVWKRGCRWLQSWWRETQLGLPPGPHKPTAPGKAPTRERPVASNLPLDVGWDTNFFSTQAATAAEHLAQGTGSGIVEPDRLRRSLLASQPACINLFAPLNERPAVVAGWLTAALPHLPDDIEVEPTKFEWAPDRHQHFGGGSAFDAFLTYRYSGGRGFIGIETKYAEHLPEGAPKRIRDPYIEYTDASPHWRAGASERLRDKSLQQFWLNMLLGQSLLERGQENFDRGDVIVMACGQDLAARQATAQVAAEQTDDAPVRLHWSSYQDIVSAANSEPSLEQWCETFTRRYLDFTPVLHLLRDDDPRQP